MPDGPTSSDPTGKTDAGVGGATDVNGTPAEDARAAIERLVDEHGPTLYAIARRFCGDPDRTEDLLQEVYLQAFRGWAGFEGRSDPRTWLYTIAARTCLRMRRRRAGEPDRIGSLEDLLPFGDPLIAVIPDDQEDVLQQQIRTEARERVEAGIADLPVEFRMPIVLKEIIGPPVAEVAAIMGVEEGTVRSRLHRARLKLRAAVDRAIPRTAEPAPPPAYPVRTCLDLLDAKQASLDRGVPFDTAVICDRCRSVFASLDLTQRTCRDLAAGEMPPGLRERLVAALPGDDAAG